METDICIIPPGEAGWVLLDHDQLSKLDRLYAEFNQPAGPVISEKVFALNLFGNEEENETQANTTEAE